MMLEDAFDLRADRYRLHGIAQQIADHPQPACIRQFHQHGHIRTVLPEGCVGGMPNTLPAEDTAAWFDLDPWRVKGVTAVTEPFRPELPSLAMSTTLHTQPAFAQPCPVRS
jgi:hypothetical protein